MKITNLNLDYKEIYPLIFVYSNMLDQLDRIYDTLRESESRKVNEEQNGKYFFDKWKDWFVFGSYMDEKPMHLAVQDRVTNHLNPDLTDVLRYQEEIIFNEEIHASNAIRTAVTIACTSYVEKNKITLPKNSYITNPNYAKYISDVVIGVHHVEPSDEWKSNGKSIRDLSMNYHTDFNISEWYWPSDKFFITCTTYINDDYDGGELRFFIDGDLITYKPKAGDIVVFPSGSPLFPGTHPYFHGVGVVQNGEKYFCRCYIKHEVEETEIWSSGVKLFGKEKWEQLAKDLVREDNTLHFHNDPLKVKRVYKNTTVWESPLVKKLYGK